MLEKPVKTESASTNLPEQIRVSVGTAILLGMVNGKLETKPTTAYLMTYRRGKCTANCGFCPQARRSQGRTDMLSRVSWPVFSTEQVLKQLETAVQEGKIKRVCIQALHYPNVFVHLQALVKMINHRTKVPVSVSCQPQIRRNIEALAKANAERIGIPLDAATKGLFEKIKGKKAGGPYNWEKQFELLNDAVSIFGIGKVSTHLIIGLGETEKELIETIQRCVNMGILPALFAFTPILGTALEKRSQPQIESYRRIQLARYLILQKLTSLENMCFNDKEHIVDFGVGGQTLMRIVQEGKAFRTSGCPDCNRPYYNEKPSGPIYNYPRDLMEKECVEIRKQLGMGEA